MSRRGQVDGVSVCELMWCVNCTDERQRIRMYFLALFGVNPIFFY